jgi:DNA-binding XRE family transcriptional regulator
VRDVGAGFTIWSSVLNFSTKLRLAVLVAEARAGRKQKHHCGKITIQYIVQHSPSVTMKCFVPLSAKEKRRLKVFGANVRRERCAHHLTQDELAERADLATRNLQKVEAGELNILLTTVLRIQLALRCSWKSLMPVE